MTKWPFTLTMISSPVEGEDITIGKKGEGRLVAAPPLESPSPLFQERVRWGVLIPYVS